MVIVGAKAAHVVFHEHRLPRPVESAVIAGALVIVAIALEPSLHRGPVRVYLAEDAIEISATPEEVWATIVTVGDIAPPDDLFFRGGLACPQKTRILTASHVRTETERRRGGRRV
jgi:hypothetical protein